MEKKLIKKLANASYVKNSLDVSRVNKIVANLSRRELREYIRVLKSLEKKFTVYIEHTNELSEVCRENLENLFKDKRIIFRRNDDLILGIRIIENDIIYNLNLKNSLKRIEGYFERYI